MNTPLAAALLAVSAVAVQAATIPTLKATVQTDSGQRYVAVTDRLYFDRTPGVQSIPIAFEIDFEGPDRYYQMMMGGWNFGAPKLTDYGRQAFFAGARDFSHNGIADRIIDGSSGDGLYLITRSYIYGYSGDGPLRVDLSLWQANEFAMSTSANVGLRFFFEESLQSVTEVPLPASILLLSVGVAALVARRHPRRPA